MRRTRHIVRGPEPATGPMTRHRAVIWLSLALVALTVAVFAPVRHFDFVSWDDPSYVSENPVVSRGLTRAGLVWAFSTAGGPYWHPLTWLSHMADVQVFGLRAGGHHVTNLILHVVTTLLLFWLLVRMTGSSFRSAFVAALFAVHPLHVESVAWVAERKDVLSGCFWMLALWVYEHYVRAPSRRRYALLAGAFALGLMAKPMLVTLPLVLLLLDIWPLGRTSFAAPARRDGPPAGPAARLTQLVAEKVPLFTMSLAAAVLTIVVQSRVGAVQGFDSLSLGQRLANAGVSCAVYIGKAVWPSPLAAFYPLRPQPAWLVWTCLLALAGISALVAMRARRQPWLLVGWLWYLVTLLPVSGLIQVGGQALADRFTYIPLIGIFLMVAWSGADARSRRLRLAAGAAALVAVAASSIVAGTQVLTWKDSETMWRHAASAVPGNDLAHANLAALFARAGRNDEALEQFAEAIRIAASADGEALAAPGTRQRNFAARLHNDVAVLLARQGRWADAIGHFREAIRALPDFGEAHAGLGQALAAGGALEEAIREATRSVQIEPGRPEFHADLSSLLYRSGNLPAAIGHLETALRVGPGHAGAAKWHYNLAAMLAQTGDAPGARQHLTASLQIDPGYEPARRALDLMK
jgi:protein O-mannosyl-transferase